MPIYMMRHAQSASNEAYEANREYNFVNTPLSKKGIREASKIQGHYDMVVLSNLKRSYQTLNYSKITYTNLIMTPLCREYLRGDISSLLKKELVNTPKESIDDLLNRCQKFKILINTLNKQYNNILVITHGIFLYHLLDLSPSTRFNNCEIRRIK